MKDALSTRERRAQQRFEPLSDFYTPTELCELQLEPLPAEQLPRAQRTLLAHANDMTSTLERHHGERISLRVLEKKLDPSWLSRLVVLVGDNSARVLEFGAIRINLDLFEHRAKMLIVECRRPLGAILQECQIEYHSRPAAFFRVRADKVIHEAMGAAAGTWLFGRHNQLFHHDHEVLASVVEILPDD